MNSRTFFRALLAFAISTGAFAKSHHKDDATDTSGPAADGLKNAVVLIIRHAEKPDSGAGLAPAGVERANRYPAYFESYTVDSVPMKPDSLFAAADSKNSSRPRLTIEPLSRALGLTIDTEFKDAKFAELAAELRGKSHGKCILICWHHEEIADLVQALGADAGQVIPDSKWPGSVYNWVIQLRYDEKGKLRDAKRIEENFQSPP
jgi:hypothetical protein